MMTNSDPLPWRDDKFPGLRHTQESYNYLVKNKADLTDLVFDPRNPVVLAFERGEFQLEWLLQEYNHDTDSWVWIEAGWTTEPTQAQVDEAITILKGDN